jgi:cephalosporin hydroxylase
VKRIWKVSADLVSQSLYVSYLDGSSEALPLYSLAAFRVIAHLWMKTGWATKYCYNFSWMGRPVIQLPEDLIMLQEVIYRVQPDVLIETGVAHGGSGIFYASLFEAMGKGRTISIDIEIRPHNRQGIEAHPLKKRVTLIERSSLEPETLREVKGMISPGERVMVVLDSNHTRDHVLRELELYAPLVTSGSYLAVADGNMDMLNDVPGGKQEWVQDNPRVAVRDFLARHPEFELDPEPTRLATTYWPDGFLKRK